MAIYLMKEEDIKDGNDRVFLATPALLKRVGIDFVKIDEDKAAELGINIKGVNSKPVNKFRNEPTPDPEPAEEKKAEEKDDEKKKDEEVKETPPKAKKRGRPKVDKVEDAKQKLLAEKLDPSTWDCDINDKKSLFEYAEKSGLKIDPWEFRMAKEDEIVTMIKDFIKEQL